MSIDYLKRILTAKVYDVADESPLDAADILSTRLSNRVLLKREDMQPVFSFKLRGAYNRMARLSAAQLARGVIAASAGNHAQGVALSARRLGCRAVIVMPVTTPQLKIDAVRALGAEVVLTGESYSDAAVAATAQQAREGLTFVHPFDDPDVIAGQGTIGMEIMRQHQGPLHAIFVPIGGGGLAAGVAAYVKQVRPEVRMIGVQTPFAPIELPGLLYYLRDGNVWKIEGSSANRAAVLAVGNLDGRVLSLSGDGDWLLFTRPTEDEEQINELWAADISGEGEIEPGAGQPALPMASLGVKNVTQFADFVPNTNNKVLFSTVEPRQAAPGWQANNDLQQLTFSPNGWTTQWTEVMEPNAGGIYGWWGTSFFWGPDPRYLAYARADSVGIVDYRTGVMTPTLNLPPLQTGRDWAWVPGLAWGPDGKALYTIDHIAPEGALDPEESQVFDLTAVLLDGGSTLHMVSQTGMFAYPLGCSCSGEASG